MFYILQEIKKILNKRIKKLELNPFRQVNFNDHHTFLEKKIVFKIASIGTIKIFHKSMC